VSDCATARRRARFVLVFTLLLDGCACRFHPCEGPPTPLLGPLVSHASIAQTKAQLGEARWRVVHEDLPPETDRRPPLAEVDVEVSDFEVFGSRGLLQLQFFNNRLVGVTFSPPDPERVFAELSRMPGVRHVSDSQLHLAPATEIRLVTFQGRTRLIVSDACLTQEADDWIRRYAAVWQDASREVDEAAQQGVEADEA
jgi:hypothetical protein